MLQLRFNTNNKLILVCELNKNVLVTKNVLFNL